MGRSFKVSGQAKGNSKENERMTKMSIQLKGKAGLLTILVALVVGLFIGNRIVEIVGANIIGAILGVTGFLTIFFAISFILTILFRTRYFER